MRHAILKGSGRLAVLAVFAFVISAFGASAKSKCDYQHRDAVWVDMLCTYENFFQANEQALRVERQNGLDSIARSPTLSDLEKKQASSQMHKNYQKKSAQNVAKYRDPVISYAKKLANNALGLGYGAEDAIKDSVGSGLLVRNDVGVPVRINDKHRGFRGDRDMQANRRAMAKLSNILHDAGFDVKIEGGDLTLDVKELELTVNKNVDFGKPGSPEHLLAVRGVSQNFESYVHVSMPPDQAGRKSIEIEDHLTKGRYGRDMDPGVLFEDGFSDKRQLYAKGTSKAIRAAEIPDTDIQRIIDKHGLNMTSDEFGKTLDKLKSDQPLKSTKLNKGNYRAFQKTVNEVQDVAATKARLRFNEDIADTIEEIKVIEKRLEQGRYSDPDLNTRANKRVARLKDGIIDSRIRYAEVNANRLGVSPPDLDISGRAIYTTANTTMGDIPLGQMEGNLTSRVKALLKNSEGLVSGLNKLGNAANVLSFGVILDQKLGKINSGDALEVVGALGETTWEVFKEDIVCGAASAATTAAAGKYAVAANYGPQVLVGIATFCATYNVTSLIASLPIPYTGTSINKLSENAMTKTLDIYRDTVTQERIAIAVATLNDELRYGGKILDGMSTVEAAERIVANWDNHRSSFDGIGFEPLAGLDALYQSLSEQEKRQVQIAVDGDEYQAWRLMQQLNLSKESVYMEALAEQYTGDEKSGVDQEGYQQILALLEKVEQLKKLPPNASTDDILDKALNKGRKTSGEYRRYEAALIEAREARAHLTQVLADIQARDKQRKVDNARLLSEIASGVGAFAQAYSEAQIKAGLNPPEIQIFDDEDDDNSYTPTYKPPVTNFVYYNPNYNTGYTGQLPQPLTGRDLGYGLETLETILPGNGSGNSTGATGLLSSTESSTGISRSCECYRSGVNGHSKPDNCVRHIMGPMTPYLGGHYDAKDGNTRFNDDNNWCSSN